MPNKAPNQYQTRAAELRADQDYVTAHMTALLERTGTDAYTDEDRTAFDEGKAYLERTDAEIADQEERGRMADRAAAGRTALGDAPTVHRGAPAAEDVSRDWNASPVELRDAVLRNLEEHDVDDSNVRTMFKRHGSDDRWARGLVARSSDAYASAFSKMLTGRDITLTEEERAALSGSTDAEGGFMVPTHLDPTIILTNEGSANALRPISRVISHTVGDTWVGVSSAGVTASFDARQTEVSDDSPGDFAAPSVPLHKAQAFVQAELEALQDIAGLPGEVMMMFSDARDRLEGNAHCVGTGTNQPTGIFTALDANTNVEINSTTAAVIGLVDLQAIRRGVGQRWRGRGSWVTNPTWADEVRNLGTALSASFSAFLTDGPVESWYGRPVVETDDAPETLTTTALDQRLVFGDFSNYVIVDKPGSMAIQFVPTLFATANNLPNGTVGWFNTWRTGADSVNDLAFRILLDETSA